MTKPTTDLMAMFAAHNVLSAIDRQEAEQPQPIALQMFDSVPRWAIVCAADSDRNAPLIRAGEVVVAEDGRCWLPVDGGLFLAEYVSAPAIGYDREKRHNRIVQTRKGAEGWYAGGIRQGEVGQTVYVADGPYADATKLAEKLVGRVVGVLRTASFIERTAKGGR